MHHLGSNAPHVMVGQCCRCYSLLFLVACVHDSYTARSTCSERNIMVGSSVNYKRLSELHEQATSFSVDPCEDFYKFACGNWITSQSNTTFSFHERLYKIFTRAIKGLLEEDRGPQKVPLTRAQSFYKKCLSSNDEWKSRGGPIQFILEKIRGFGSFPIIDMSWSYGDHFDITDLLVYFNQNRTIMKELVPWISADFMNNSIARLAVMYSCSLFFIRETNMYDFDGLYSCVICVMRVRRCIYVRLYARKVSLYTAAFLVFNEILEKKVR
ncbi:hypothetical protein Y032_0139g2121 [Ancylostoma ceylanicum]|uniref:Peptidase M13 N-terminal domain-containing protein n=1 Tax=Ancylostoma ceylanicum TaxID=53326 RepID=A0A016T4F7_9BILA|nr:hypothetical protein Y032_0139g2121 [Ancylostoma ceylanicum]